MQTHIGGRFVEAGDLFAASVRDAEGLRWLLVSFHGDSDGLSTQPVLSGVHRACLLLFRDHVLLAGIDANTNSTARGGRPGPAVGDFRRLLAAQGMASVWDGVDDPFVKTTCGARTSLQTQLHKAVGYRSRFSAASVSLKDWILCYAAQVRAAVAAAAADAWRSESIRPGYTGPLDCPSRPGAAGQGPVPASLAACSRQLWPGKESRRQGCAGPRGWSPRPALNSPPTPASSAREPKGQSSVCVEGPPLFNKDDRLLKYANRRFGLHISSESIARIFGECRGSHDRGGRPRERERESN